VLVGTAGAYPGGPPIGSVVCARRVGWAHGVAELGLGYVPRAPEDLETDPDLRAQLGLPEADVVTVGAITTSPELAAVLARRGQVEHMEAWSVARAAQRAGVPFAAVLGVTNEVGPDAHAAWKANREEVEARARQAAAVLLKGRVGTARRGRDTNGR
jgi:futalosine hydrolase